MMFLLLFFNGLIDDDRDPFVSRCHRDAVVIAVVIAGAEEAVGVPDLCRYSNTCANCSGRQPSLFRSPSRRELELRLYHIQFSFLLRQMSRAHSGQDFGELRSLALFGLQFFHLFWPTQCCVPLLDFSCKSFTAFA